ncbi:MAG: hypothetical protein KBG20_12915 [Caldilineaceae bacterium]|nr:hypothetical protein [Caldilineaceae bacterium]MBP8109359.1 hypothetical protein [Caldilineaceae bacterium]MBP8125213.1 hypothetical protein [Caldilineaceae bacterium]MBP9073198.1 hypothetical protein [Caldilineaceae bacterium]
MSNIKDRSRYQVHRPVVGQAAVSGEISVIVRVVDLAGNGIEVEAEAGVDKPTVSSPQGG